ncbi:hypothetical protein [Alkaliphilus sp. B6464]|uniref:hypothetical protein n=1 Tax=Alkaliphilus sp. B6464 TaxID=2731219 RepID=UPI001BAB4159|nr:hypothetical protein [Alkaliphilus sp. B6464]QUH21918.1 hypothetical protein HYG84_18455 [Alkaliphilus sp. B6464]
MFRIVKKIGRAGGPKNREKSKNEWDKKYGVGKWKVVYQYNNEIYTREQALEKFYNRSYYEYLKNHPTTLNNLCNMANSLYNPHADATGGVDLQVPAVYKALEHLNKSLQGAQRIAIGTWGYKQGIEYPQISWELSPYKVPLWCNKDISIEVFWQDYKYLAVQELEQLSLFSNNTNLSSEFSITEEIGDLFNTNKLKYVYAHCIAEDCHVNAGITKIFDKKDPLMKVYLKPRAIIGKAIKYESNKVGKVYNLITKDQSWKAARVPGKTYYRNRECIPYDEYLKNLRLCLDDLKDQMIVNNEKFLVMPKIASGLDKCRWEDVKPIIVKVFSNTDISIIIRMLD